MTQRIKYKVISFSSEEREYPVSSLLVPGSDGWQTKRFCNYPQEVTLQFYGVVHIDKIQVLADSRKIASSVDILYYDPTESGTESRFTKYGALEFSRNQGGKIHEQKTVMVDMRCLYLRFLFHRPYKNKQNFFSQVHIHQLTIYGGESNIMLPLDTSIGKKNSIPIDARSIAEEQDEYVYQKLTEIQRRKDQAVAQEDYDQAERMKQVMMNVKKFGYKLKALKEKKSQAADKEDYQLAKSLKEEMDRMKREVDILVNETLEGGMDQDEEQQHQQVEHDVQGNEFVGLEINKMLDRQDIDKSRISQKNSRVKNNSTVNKRTQRSNYLENSYDERIIPTLQNKLKTEESQVPNQYEETRQSLGPAEDINGNNAADASTMMQFFQQETVKQFFSKHWQHKQKALTDIPVQAAQKPQDAPLIKCLLRVVAQSIGQTNFKLAQLSLNLFRQVIKINAKSHKLNKNNIEGRDLQKIMEEIIKKMSDNNAKIRTVAQQVFQEMLDSSLFGVEYCCTSLIKSGGQAGSKGSVKHEIQRLSSLAIITTKYGLGANGAPHSVIDFGVEKLSNPSADVRNEAIHLLAVCSTKEQKLVAAQLQGKKATYMQQIQARQKQLQNKSSKK